MLPSYSNGVCVSRFYHEKNASEKKEEEPQRKPQPDLQKNAPF